MTGVEKMEQKRKNRGVDGPDGKHLLMDIEQKSENTIELGSTHLRITLTVAPDFELTVVDDSEPKKGSRAMDFCKGIFHGLDEIDKLRVNAPQSPAGNQGQTHSNERRQFTENVDGPNPVRLADCCPGVWIAWRVILPQALTTRAVSRDMFARYAQHKLGQQSGWRLSLQRIRRFFEDAECETKALLHRPCQ